MIIETYWEDLQWKNNLAIFLLFKSYLSVEIGRSHLPLQWGWSKGYWEKENSFCKIKYSDSRFEMSSLHIGSESSVNGTVILPEKGNPLTLVLEVITWCIGMDFHNYLVLHQTNQDTWIMILGKRWWNRLPLVLKMKLGIIFGVYPILLYLYIIHIYVPQNFLQTLCDYHDLWELPKHYGFKSHVNSN